MFPNFLYSISFTSSMLSPPLLAIMKTSIFVMLTFSRTLVFAYSNCITRLLVHKPKWSQHHTKFALDFTLKYLILSQEGLSQQQYSSNFWRAHWPISFFADFTSCFLIFIRKCVRKYEILENWWFLSILCNC